MLSLPFFIFDDWLGVNFNFTYLKRSENLRFIILGLVISVLIYYFKDLSIALGQTDRIPLVLSIWAVIALSLFTLVEFYKSMRSKYLIVLFIFLCTKH